MDISLVEISRLLVITVGLYGSYKDIKNSRLIIRRNALSSSIIYQRTLKSLENKMYNVLFGKPNSRERIILLTAPLGVVVAVMFYLLHYIKSSGVDDFQGFLLEFFINSDKGINFVSYIAILMMYLWLFFKLYYRRSLRRYPSKAPLMSFHEKLLYQLVEILMELFSVIIISGMILYALGLYALYLQFRDASYIYSIVITILFLALFFMYILRDYLRLRSSILGMAGYSLILHGHINPPKVKVVLKNGREILGQVVPPYTDKNVMVVLYFPYFSDTPRVLNYIPWDEISCFELYEINES